MDIPTSFIHQLKGEIALRVLKKLVTGVEKRYPYGHLSDCAQSIILAAIVNCAEDNIEFKNNQNYFIILKPFQFFLGGVNGLNAIKRKDDKNGYQRDQYRHAMHQISKGTWAKVISDNIPTRNHATGGIIYVKKIGTIVDISLWLTEEEREKAYYPFGELNNHGNLEVTTMPISSGNPIKSEKIRPNGNRNNHANQGRATMSVGSEKIEQVRNQNNHGNSEITTMLTLPENSIKSEKIGQDEDRNTHANQDRTTILVNEKNPVKTQYPNSHDDSEGIAMGTSGGNTIKSAEIRTTGKVNSHAESIPTANKYSCCIDERISKLSDKVPKDENNHPLCPKCKRGLEYNDQYHFWGHWDYKDGPCKKTYTDETLIKSWEKQKTRMQQQRKQQQEIKVFVEDYTKDIEEKANKTAYVELFRKQLPGTNFDIQGTK